MPCIYDQDGFVPYMGPFPSTESHAEMLTPSQVHGLVDDNVA